MSFNKPCCNIFEKTNHKHAVDQPSMRRVSEQVIEKASSLGLILNVGMSICNACRIELLYKHKQLPQTLNTRPNNDSDQTMDVVSSEEYEICSIVNNYPIPIPSTSITPHTDEMLNEVIGDINEVFARTLSESPIKNIHSMSDSKKYRKIEMVTSSISRKLFRVPPPTISPPYEEPVYDDWLGGLKDAYKKAISNEEKTFLLTTIPRNKNWNSKRIELEFGVSRRFVENAMLLDPYTRPGKKGMYICIYEENNV